MKPYIKITATDDHGNATRLRMGDDVVTVTDRWPGDRYWYFKCLTDSGEQIILRRDAPNGPWQWVAYRHPAAPTGMTPNPKTTTGGHQ